MSALLAIDASELNISAEYGYNSRSFNKYPMVHQSYDYTSCLFLVYHQINPIQHRIPKYRNHFTLFTNDKTVVIARTETTLIHHDNDAIITYDIITPSDDVSDRFRSKYKTWDVSFDKITYSNNYPNLVGYRMICSGEWWFYDRGVILNGLTGYEPKTKSLSMFIYYEFHIKHKITRPSSDTLINMPPLIQSLNTQVFLQPNNTVAIGGGGGGDGRQSISPTTTIPPPSTQTSSVLSPTTTTTTTTTTTPIQQDTVQSLNKPFTISSVPSTILPYLNVSSRPTITQNDSTVAPEVQFKAVMPSLFWFDERCKELSRGDIEYFRPLDYRC